MLPVLRGLIARRVLLNFRADPHIVQALLPKPFEAETFRGSAIVGVCLIRLQELRPSRLPKQVGLASENVAHRVAVRYPENGERKTGVFVWRRATDQRLVQMFGGRLFPGVHDGAKFSVQDDGVTLTMDVKSPDGSTDVAFTGSETQSWQSSSAFPDLNSAAGFFQKGDCGFSCSLGGDAVEGMQLRIVNWAPSPLAVQLKKAAFYFDHSRFPAGSVEFDCALIMRDVPHEWHEIRQVPDLETATA